MTEIDPLKSFPEEGSIKQEETLDASACVRRTNDYHFLIDLFLLSFFFDWEAHFPGM